MMLAVRDNKRKLRILNRAPVLGNVSKASRTLASPVIASIAGKEITPSAVKKGSSTASPAIRTSHCAPPPEIEERIL